MKYKPKPRDKWGAIIGSKTGRVNAAMSSRKWLSIPELAERAKLPPEVIRRRLYTGIRKGTYLGIRDIKYKLNPKKQKKK